MEEKERRDIIDIDAWRDSMATCLPVTLDMEKFIRKINDEYSIKINKIKKLDDKKCEADTGGGIVVIEKVNDCKARAAFFNGLYEHIKNRGFADLVEICKSSNGNYYTDLGGEFYIVYRLEYGPMRSMEGYEESIIRTIARFHRCSEGYIPPVGSKHKSGWGKCIDKYKDGLRDIKNYRDSIRVKDIRPSFETLFLRNCDKYICMMEEALSLLINKGYLDVVEDRDRKSVV